MMLLVPGSVFEMQTQAGRRFIMLFITRLAPPPSTPCSSCDIHFASESIGLVDFVDITRLFPV